MLKLRTLRAVNVFQHKDVTYTYRPGIFGFTGPNGSGKSTFMHEIQFFALTGAFMGSSVKYTKKDALRWGKKEGHTELVFEVQGEEYTLTRWLPGSKIELLKKGDEKPLKQKEAQACMDGLLGLPADLIHELCFVEQGGLVGLVRATNTQRMDYFHKLAGTQQAERIREQLQEQITRIPLKAINQDRLETLRTQVPELEKSVEAQVASVAETQAELDKDKEHVQNAHHLVSLPLAETLESSRKQAQEQQDLAQGRLTTFTREHAEALEMEGESPEISAEMQQQARSYEALVDADEKLAEAKKELQELLKPGEKFFAEEPQMPDRKKVDEAQEAYSALDPTIRLLQMDCDTCPTCNQPMPEMTDEVREKYQADVDAAVESLRLARARHDQDMTSYRSQHKQWQAAVQRKESQKALVTKLQVSVKDLEEKTKGFDPDAYEALLDKQNEWNAKLQECNRLLREQAALENALQKAQGEVARLAEVKAVKKEDQDQAKQFLHNRELLLDGLRESQTALASMKATLKGYHGEIQQIEEQQKQNEAADAFRETLTRARDLFHRDALPKLTMRPMLEQMNTGIQFFLDLFQAPFSCYLDDDFCFMVSFTHQEDKDARTALSGGQCVTLALSFRFAAMEILNCPVPLLALDEPTQFLDTASREAMVDVIKSLTPLTEKGLTIQMATHESSLATAFHDELKFVRQY